MNYKNYLKKGKSRIAVWGSGYIGLSTMAFFSRKKIKCVGYDINEKTVDTINSGKLPITELKDWFGFDIKSSVKKKYLQATNDHKKFYSLYPHNLMAFKY